MKNLAADESYLTRDQQRLLGGGKNESKLAGGQSGPLAL
jgi:hypothetical protein